MNRNKVYVFGILYNRENIHECNEIMFSVIIFYDKVQEMSQEWRSPNYAEIINFEILQIWQLLNA